ncbi:kinase-like domain-containing protein [Lentinula guzmanii]|uniref:non-specific serine/threonine protein kinase n=1 Tax=Lentinula guzmanii TaxID=2804957 RepID=A0AA38JTE3_9AGAR|nr:kinase-like domain-containing protein [Lentinula guzmanii]
MDYKFGGKYLLEQEIANGGCGTVFLGTHHIAGKQVAIKLEPATEGRKSMRRNPYPGLSPLTLESQIYKRLMGAPGVPFLLHSGKSGPYNVLVMDLLGPSLDDLSRRCGRRFSLKTTCMLAVQCLDRLEYIHGRGVLHRDIKPANFVMSRTTPSIVNIIDFGLAKRYRQPLNGEHIPYSQHPDALHGVGTSLYASLNTHFGVESGRRDDLESLAYMLIGFVRGGLPWRKVRATVDPPPNWPSKDWNPITQTWNLIREEKVKAEAALLRTSSNDRRQHTHAPTSSSNPTTLLTGLPEEFGVLYRYARTLQFTDLPDYEGLRQLFRGLAEREGFLDAEGEYTGVWDWDAVDGKVASNPVSLVHGQGRFCEACNKRAAEAAGVGSLGKRRKEWV